MIPAGELDLLRQHPQSSDIYMIIQQPERFTEAEYMSARRWIDYVWSCRVHADPLTDPVYNLSVDTPSGNANLLDGMTVLISSTAYGEWDRGIVRLRTDQVVNGATNTLTIAPASEFRGRVKKGDYVVVLDEFRLWQRFSRVELVAGVVLWYKDWDLRWINIGANDPARRLAMLPPVPIMGPHAVKFIDTPNVNSQFYFDWSNSYPTAQGAAMATWASWGQQDFAGNTWTSAAQVPGWQATKGISGLKGFRVVLEVNDGNGNALTLPYRRGVRYVFTLRRPGQKQPGDPENAEPIVNFTLNESVAGSFSQGYWRTSVTISHEEADKYAVLPGALVILFTDDWYMADSPYLAPTGMRNVSLGPIYDRENILLVGRVADGSITVDPETSDVTFEVLSTGEESSRYENVPIVVQDKIDSLDWIDVPNLTVDRAAHMYIAWHTTMSLVADVYQTGDTHTLYAMDFTAGDIYSTINNFYWDRIFARLLCDKYGRFFSEVDVQMQPYGSVDTEWVLDDGDWLDSLNIKHYEASRCKAAECGGVTYIGGAIGAVLSRAPGVFDKYRGTLQPSNYLAVNTQAELNILSGRFLEYQNYEWEVGMQLAGNWRHLDIVPQAATYADIDAERGPIDGRLIIRAVSNDFNVEAGCIFTSIQTEIEEDDGVPGVTVVVPTDLPDKPRQPDPHDGKPWDPPTGEDSGRRIIATDVGVYACDNIEVTTPYWYGVNAGLTTAGDRYTYDIKRDPYHWWTGTERTLWAVTRTGIWKHESFPSGTWVCQITYAQLLAYMGYVGAGHGADWLSKGRMNLSIENDGRYAVICNLPDMIAGWWERTCVFVCQDAAIVSGTVLCADGMGAPGVDTMTGWGDVAFAQHHGYQQIYATSARTWNNAAWAEFRLWRTNNGAAAIPIWATIDGPMDFWNGGPYTSVAIPYDTAANMDLWVYWTAGESAGCFNTARRSINGGAAFADIPGVNRAGFNKIRDGLMHNRMFAQAIFPALVACRWTGDDAVTWNISPIPVMGGGLEAIDNFILWNGDVLRSALVGGFPTGAPPATGVIYYWKYGLAAWLNKTGNLISAYAVSVVMAIDRDSSGSA